MPKKGESRPDRKTEEVRFRITAEEKQLLQAAAAREHLSLSAWLRRLALQTSQPQR